MAGTGTIMAITTILTSIGSLDTTAGGTITGTGCQVIGFTATNRGQRREVANR